MMDWVRPEVPRMPHEDLLVFNWELEKVAFCFPILAIIFLFPRKILLRIPVWEAGILFGDSLSLSLRIHCGPCLLVTAEVPDSACHSWASFSGPQLSWLWPHPTLTCDLYLGLWLLFLSDCVFHTKFNFNLKVQMIFSPEKLSQTDSLVHSESPLTSSLHLFLKLWHEGTQCYSCMPDIHFPYLLGWVSPEESILFFGHMWFSPCNCSSTSTLSWMCFSKFPSFEVTDSSSVCHLFL